MLHFFFCRVGTRPFVCSFWERARRSTMRFTSLGTRPSRYGNYQDTSAIVYTYSLVCLISVCIIVNGFDNLYRCEIWGTHPNLTFCVGQENCRAIQCMRYNFRATVMQGRSRLPPPLSVNTWPVDMYCIMHALYPSRSLLQVPIYLFVTDVAFFLLLFCCCKGGNDYEIFESDRTIGHTVTSPEDTIKQCKELFFKD